MPGEQWAPALVSWRKGGDYVGWAPLPPEAQFDRETGIHNWADNYYDIGPDQYAFVPANEFGRKLTAREIVPTERNVTIINQTTNVTHFIVPSSCETPLPRYVDTLHRAVLTGEHGISNDFTVSSKAEKVKHFLDFLGILIAVG